MNRQGKSVVIDSLKQQLKKSSAAFVVDYKGLSVNQLETLRKRLREHGSLFKVAKARLMKRAVSDFETMKPLETYFKDQIAFIFSQNEPIQTAKSLHAFAQGNENLKIMVGYADSKMLTREEIIALATLPSREVLLAMLCGVLMAPVASFARVLDQMAKKQGE